MNEVYRGSRKHILDWTDLKEDAFVSWLNELLHPTGAVVGPSDLWMPRGYDRPKEAKLHASYVTFLPKALRRQLSDWWLVHKRGANVPNWDLIATCSIGVRRGLVLVEAKAHGNELSPAGKGLRANASDNSRENHEQIGRAIEEARAALDRIVPGVGISRDRHYQLSNRVAFAWKLALLGVPSILTYLGFIGDEGIADVGPHFRSKAHWRETVWDYMKQVLPSDFVERPIPCGAATMQLIICSRDVLTPSPRRGEGTSMS
jgi:hypothetical protein